MPGWRPTDVLARWARSRRPRLRTRDVIVAAPVEEALHASAGALRRLGARLTRYEPEHGTLEARLTRFTVDGVLRVRAEAHGQGQSRLRLESDVMDWWIVFARFAAELSDPRGR